MTENGICVDRRLTKISEALVFEYDRAAMMTPWRVRTAVTDRIGLLFEPEFERASESGRRTATSRTPPDVGCYSGRITPDGGDPIDLLTLLR